MKALILAAGRGSRMRHLTEDRPKGLTPLRGTPLVERQCAALHGAGATEIGIVTGYMAESFDAHADRTFHNPRWAETQMVTSMAAAADWLTAGPVLVSYSDIFYQAETLRALAGATAALAISYDPDWQAQWAGRFEDPLDDAETFRLRTGGDGLSYLTAISAKPDTLAEVEGQYMGLLRFTPASWDAVQKVRADLAADRRDALSMTALLDLLIARGIDIQAVPSIGPWGEIDSVEDLAFFEEHAPKAI